jgi:hypothetical protein
VSNTVRHTVCVTETFDEVAEACLGYRRFRGQYSTPLASKRAGTVPDAQLPSILLGRTVKTLTDANHKPGHYSLTWNRTDDRDKKLSEGVYFIRLFSPNCEKKRKAVIAE